MCSNNDEMIKFKLITLRSKSETKKRKRWCSDVMLGMGGANGPPSHPRVGEPGGNFWATASPGNLSLAAMGHAGTRNVAEMAASIRMSHTEAMACLSGSGNPSTAQTSNGWERFNGTVAAHYCTKKIVSIDLQSSKKEEHTCNIHATAYPKQSQVKTMKYFLVQFCALVISWSWILFPTMLRMLDGFTWAERWASNVILCLFWGLTGWSGDLASPESSTHLRSTGPCTERSWKVASGVYAMAPHRWKCVKVPKRKAAARSNPKPVAPSVPLLFALWDFSKLWKLLELLGPSQHLWLLEWPIRLLARTASHFLWESGSTYDLRTTCGGACGDRNSQESCDMLFTYSCLDLCQPKQS